MRKNLLLLCAFMMANVALMAQTSLQGAVKDAETGEPLLFANIELFRNDVFITGVQTDFEGNYSFSSIEPGTYDVQSSYVGYQTVREVGVVVKAGQTNPLNISLSEGVMMDVDVTIRDYKVPLIEIDQTTSGTTVTAEKIKSLPAKSIAGIAATSSGVSTNESGDISMRGSRTDATNYFIDGVRVIGLIPQTEVEQLQVINGGIEAKYGDVTGGIISLTSKGPSQQFTGALEVETSEKLDNAGYNLLAGSLSGPILKNSKNQSILGFRVSGQYRNIADNRPSAIGYYRASEELIREIEANPTTNFRGTIFPAGEFLTSADIPNTIDTRPNNGLQDLNLTAKIDAKLAKNVDVSLSGSLIDSKNQFSPSFTNSWTLLNWVNNPFQYNSGYRVNFLLKHKIGTQGIVAKDANGEAQKPSSFRNAYYSLQASYEVDRDKREDLRHEDNFFNYGYFGNIDRTWSPTASIVTDQANTANAIEIPNTGLFFSHQGYTQNEGEYTPNSSINPVLASYNDLNGFINPNVSSSWGLYSNVGQVYNRYEKNEEQRYTANITAGFDYLPGGSENGKHSIQLGFAYEQRSTSRYVLLPQTLWQIARLQANNHIIGVDTSIVLGTFDQGIFGQNFTFPQYQTLVDPNNVGQFAEEVRKLTNTSLNDYVNTDGLNPDDLSLALFSARELTDQNIISYRGYNYLGEKNSGNVTFEDFWNKRDDKGRRTFEVAAFKPIYGAAYIQDKFQYKDIIFRLGVRMDYYDANTKVLKDPYALYEIEKAGEFYARTGGEKPEAVSDDYSVYVGGETSDNVIGYRKDDTWFLPNGTAVSNGNVLFDGGIVYPAYKGRDSGRVLNIQADGFDPNTSFDDYKPQINIMPRLAFSFPISEDANFFAHYDILVQRPNSGNIATALDYYYFNDPSRTPLNNPNLKPEKTIDYELGFQQKLTQSSAFKVSAYYKELRDMIQRRFYSNVAAPVNSYESIGNIDFGTVKGFSFTYDRRRVGNLEFTANYTLSFANGTGSDVNSSSGINSRGIIRNLIPFTYDERHRFTTTMDFRYAEGKRYNGPRIAGKDIFANAGVNFIVTAVSGRPYSRFSTPNAVSASPNAAGYLGAINGARLPWQFDVDMRIDKNFSFKFSEESSRSLSCNVYLRVENLLNLKNIIGVYPVTGDADNDGYLISTFGQDRIAQIEQIGQSVESFLSSYQWRVLDPGNYVIPRRIYLGATFQF